MASTLCVSLSLGAYLQVDSFDSGFPLLGHFRVVVGEQIPYISNKTICKPGMKTYFSSKEDCVRSVLVTRHFCHVLADSIPIYGIDAHCNLCIYRSEGWHACWVSIVQLGNAFQMPHAYIHSIQFRRLFWRQRIEFNLQVLSLQLLGVPFDRLSILSIHCYTGPSFLMVSDDHESLRTDAIRQSSQKRGVTRQIT